MDECRAVAKADLSSIRDAIADRIKKSFVELMPEDAWKNLVQKEIDRFLAPSTSYGAPERSPLQEMVETEIRLRLAGQVSAELSKPEYESAGYCTMGNEQAGAAVKKIIGELVPEIVAAAFGDTVQRVIDHVRNGLSQHMT